MLYWVLYPPDQAVRVQSQQVHVQLHQVRVQLQQVHVQLQQVHVQLQQVHVQLQQVTFNLIESGVQRKCCEASASVRPINGDEYARAREYGGVHQGDKLFNVRSKDEGFHFVPIKRKEVGIDRRISESVYS